MKKLGLDIFKALAWGFCLSHIFQKVPELLIVQGPQSSVWWQGGGLCLPGCTWDAWVPVPPGRVPVL